MKKATPPERLYQIPPLNRDELGLLSALFMQHKEPILATILIAATSDEVIRSFAAKIHSIMVEATKHLKEDYPDPTLNLSKNGQE